MRAQTIRRSIQVVIVLASTTLLTAGPGIMTIPRTAQLNPPVTIVVDPTVNRHPIDPRIYGASFASPAAITDLGLTLNRWGGNRSTRYNWQMEFGNTAKDYFFENLDEAGAFGIGTADSFCDTTRAAGAQPILTIPMIGWTAKDTTNCSFSVLKYGAQDAIDPFNTDCGNGLQLGVPFDHDPNDSSQPAPSTFEAQWIQHLIVLFHSAANGGIRYYSLDNEPSLWNSSHRDIHPLPVSYDEAWNAMADYGAAIRAEDPGAVITGPEEWEWVALFDSQQDWEANSSADRNAPAHQGLDYIAYLLKKANEYEHAPGGKRILDVLTIHYYAQGNLAVGGPEINEFSDVITSDMQLLRNRSTRALWDPDYVDQSWMGSTTYPGTGTLLNGGKPHLIPELKRYVAAYYPGTQVGLTEYNWGADNHINGGTAQADILGILGREGADLGVRWQTPPTGSFTYDAFMMYRNCDGAHSAFGDSSVSAGGPDPDHVSVFASVRSSDNKLMVMIINKDGDDTPATVSLSHFAPTVGPVIQRHQLTSTVLGMPLMEAPPNLSVANGAVSLTLPAQSVTLLVMAGTILPPSLNVGADYGGDTKGDVLLRDGGSGSLSMWMMNGSTIVSSAAVGSPGGSYSVAGVGDFNGDGKGDILLRDLNGTIGMWIMNGSSIASGALVGSPGGSYNVVAIGDFNGDGKDDILLRDVNGTLGVWLMNGPVITAGALVGSPGGSYSVAGVADFNNDGKDDILLRDGLGTLGMWLMNGATITAGALVGSPGGSYTVAGVGDFNGDGKADILLRDATGTYGMWLMNGATIVTGALVGSPGGGFNVSAVNDYSGDGKADILLRDPTGTFGMWIMNGTTISSGALVGSAGATYTAY
jgi:uncharacterized protein (DUF2141 family)